MISLDKAFVFSVQTMQAIDVDTVVCDLDMGFGISTNRSIRLIGVNGPELHTKNALEKEAATKAKNTLGVWFFRGLSSNDREHFAIKLLSVRQKDKYGRVLGDFVKGKEFLCDFLLKNGFVKPYDGKKKPVWTNKELQAILDLDLKKIL